MKIYLRGGPCNGQTEVVSEDCPVFLIDGSIYKIRSEFTAKGSPVFAYDEKASKRRVHPDRFPSR